MPPGCCGATQLLYGCKPAWALTSLAFVMATTCAHKSDPVVCGCCDRALWLWECAVGISEQWQRRRRWIRRGRFLECCADYLPWPGEDLVKLYRRVIEVKANLLWTSSSFSGNCITQCACYIYTMSVYKNMSVYKDHHIYLASHREVAGAFVMGYFVGDCHSWGGKERGVGRWRPSAIIKPMFDFWCDVSFPFCNRSLFFLEQLGGRTKSG